MDAFRDAVSINRYPKQMGNFTSNNLFGFPRPNTPFKAMQGPATGLLLTFSLVGSRRAVEFSPRGVQFMSPSTAMHIKPTCGKGEKATDCESTASLK